MGATEVLLSLNEICKTRNSVNPQKQLAPLYKEIFSLKSAIQAGEERMGQETREHQERRHELERLLLDVPKWEKEIGLAKEKMIRQRGLGLKDMLAIQQEVAKTEEKQLLGESRVIELQEKIKGFEEEQRINRDRINEMKDQYNKLAVKYNDEKAKADLRMAALDSQEEGLLEELSPEFASVYQDALKSCPDSPAVMLQKGICGGCHIAISRQMVKLVNLQERPVRCENCFRILLP